MPIYKGEDKTESAYKGSVQLARIYKGGSLVYENYKTLTAEGLPPIVLSNCKNTSMLGYKIYGNSVQDGTPSQSTPIPIYSVGDKTPNMLDIYGRTRRTSTATTPINTSEYYVGKAYSNYYSPTRVIKAELVGDTWHIQSQTGQNPYGLGFPIEVEPSTKYYITGTTTNGLYSTSYYDANGDFISGVSNVGSTLAFTTPANTKFAFIILRSATDDEATFKNVTVSVGAAMSDYEPAGYRIPIINTGKNLWQGVNYYKYVTGGTIIPTGTTAAIRADVYYLNSYIRQGAVTLSADITLGENDTATDRRLSAELRDTSGTRISTILSRYSTSGRYSVTVPQTSDIGYVIFRFGDYATQNTIDIEVKNIQVEVGSTDSAYETPITPVINNIYLDEPLRKVSDSADYMDFETQKVYRNVEVIDDTGELPIAQSYQPLVPAVEESVTLPAVNLVKGTNVVEVATDVIPSNVWVKYKGKGAE